MKWFMLFWISCVAVNAFPERQTKIVGGTETTVNQYPEVASLLYSYWGIFYNQACGGSILNTRSILTAAHCVVGDSASNWRIRVGSTYANSGGTVLSVGSIAYHGSYDSQTNDYDVAILRSATTIVFGTLVKQSSIAGPSYNLADNQAVWAVGWGTTSSGGSASEKLRHVQIWTVNQAVCRQRYAVWGNTITDNMLCSGWLDVGGRDQCQGDSGGPLFHNSVVVGICSWGRGCALAAYPGVNTRVSRFTAWIQANA
ncbi:trypsin CFT-1-like [Ostrinia nubilalis]|uniref:trypsin CFT-1-like n=1 Tax=Ostrinia furnacalis TaxID=93504 RepID=UPI00103C8AED|nr:trypsin CFT-1-like [Ostrinia furnacalis]